MYVLRELKTPFIIANLYVPAVHLPEKQQNKSRSTFLVEDNEVLEV